MYVLCSIIANVETGKSKNKPVMNAGYLLLSDVIPLINLWGSSVYSCLYSFESLQINSWEANKWSHFCEDGLEILS